MNKDQIIKQLRDMAKHPTVTLPRDCEALKAAADLLAHPEQEPVAWANRVIGGRKWLSIHASKGASDRWLEYRIKEQAQGEEYEQIALYTTPPQRTWIGMTEDERTAIRESVSVYHDITGWSYAKAVQQATELKLKEKNT